MKARIVREPGDLGGIPTGDEIVSPRGRFGLVFRVSDFVKARDGLIPAGPELHVTHIDDHDNARRAADLSEVNDVGVR
jgi:hypothetical protein